jgi:hypothetical protein
MIRWLGRMVLKLGGWTAVGGIPDEPKALFIAAPHTTYPDALWALAYIASIGLRKTRRSTSASRPREHARRPPDGNPVSTVSRWGPAYRCTSGSSTTGAGAWVSVPRSS